MTMHILGAARIHHANSAAKHLFLPHRAPPVITGTLRTKMTKFYKKPLRCNGESSSPAGIAMMHLGNCRAYAPLPRRQRSGRFQKSVPLGSEGWQIWRSQVTTCQKSCLTLDPLPNVALIPRIHFTTTGSSSCRSYGSAIAAVRRIPTIQRRSPELRNGTHFPS
jgi:hypothetical protein